MMPFNIQKLSSNKPGMGAKTPSRIMRHRYLH